MRKLLLTLLVLSVLVFTVNAQFIQSNGFAIYDTSAAGQLYKSVNPGPAPQNGSGSLGQIYNNSACGLNYAQASVMITTRYSPPGVGLPATLNIASIPCNSTIEQAYVWWTTSGSALTGNVTVTNPLGTPATYTATLAGTGPAKCWGEVGTRTFRADVTASIAGNGNYSINISNGASETDGATLFIIYRDLNATYRGSLVINDGCMVNSTGGSLSQTMSGINACAASTSGNAFVIASDLQPNVAASHTTVLNGVSGSYPQNFWNFDVANTSIFAGQATANFGLGTSSDCYAFAVMGLYYQTTSCVTCTPSSALTVLSSQSNVTCAGGNNGSATVTASGGTAPYTYSWSPSGGNAATATGLAAGTYTCTITDASGCMTTQAVVTITQPSAVAASQSQSNVSCFGGNNGSASVSASGGTPGYTYSWMPSGGTGATASGLSAGSYTCTITDANGCSTTRSFTISQPSALSATQSQSNVSCSGGNNAAATVSVSGGTAGYSYSWSPSGGTGATASGLSAGSYTCTITDANGCSTTSSFNISQPSALSVTMSSTNAACASSNGTATASPAGGTPGYTYAWLPSGGTSATATGLSAGSYTCTITDANGCTTTGSVTVGTPPNTLSVQSSQTNVSCPGGNNGSATVNVSGGSPGYSYSWAPSGGTGATATGLAAGTYTCTVTDAAGCTTTSVFNISEPAPLAATVSSIDESCNGACDGTASVQLTGGSGLSSVLWAPGNYTTSQVSGLCAGNYLVVMTDSSGCQTSTNVTVNSPAPVVGSVVSATDVTCNGASDGAAAVSGSGGQGQISYSWLPGGNTTSSATGLASGTYTVTISDSVGCTAQINITISEPAALSLSVTGNIVVCSGDSTLITANATGGTAPYSYLWSNGNTSSSQYVSPVSDTTYSVAVIDSNGCTTQQQSITINVSPPLVASVSPGDSICAGDSTTVFAVATGGNVPYLFSWSNGLGTGPGPFVVAPTTTTTYTCTITDGCGSTYNGSTTVVVLPAPVTSFTAAPDSSWTGEPVLFVDASASATSWQWDFGDGDTSNVQNPVHLYEDAGQYTITLITSNTYGCFDTLTYSFVHIIEAMEIPNVFTPNGDGINDEFRVRASGVEEYTIEIYNRWGMKVFETTAPRINWDGRTSSGQDASSGTYYYVLYAKMQSGKIYDTSGHITLLR